MTYTYRHKESKRLCAIVRSEIVPEGHLVYVQAEGCTRRHLWEFGVFRQWHELISPTLGRCACGNVAVEEMTLTTHAGPSTYRLCAECAALERAA